MTGQSLKETGFVGSFLPVALVYDLYKNVPGTS
jgi:hypothetical protein